MLLNRLRCFPARRPTTGPVSVCFVIDRLSHAGTETQLLALIRHLDRTRVRPSLCLLNGDDAESRSLLPDCPRLDLRLLRLRSFGSLAAANRLRQFWRRENVSVVQAYFLDSSYFALPLARACGIRRMIRVRNNAGYWLTPRHRWLGRRMGRLGTTLTNSDDARARLLSAEPASEIRVIENGVDMERFANSSWPDLTRPTIHIGAVANLRPVKNIDGLIRVADLLRDDPRLRFDVAGTGSELAHLREQICSAGLGERFVLQGSVTDIPRFLAGLDIAVNCSHSESMSNATLEYMAAGKAIVATDVGANARVIRHGIDGSIVMHGHDAALAATIRSYLHDPARAQQHAMSARQRVGETFSRERMVREFERFFCEGV